MTTIHHLIAHLTQQLIPACTSPAAAQQEAWWLLEHVMGKRKAVLLASSTLDVSPAIKQTLEAMVTQRVVDHKPLQYIVGSVPFCNLEILVQPPILIPRPESEEMVTWVIEQCVVDQEKLRILDLCTGSGCIALALAHALPQATVVGIDINTQAVALAEKNRQRSAIGNATFLQSDLFQALDVEQPFDLIISNPPYITEAEYNQLPADVKAWEDRGALLADEQGLAVYRRIIERARQFLTQRAQGACPGMPRLVFEVGTNPDAVVLLLKKHGFSSLSTHCDMRSVVRWLAVL